MDLTPIVVIEPHADDAFLSLGGHLLAWRAMERRTAIITVFPQSERRAREGKAYAETVGALYQTCTSQPDATPKEIADELEHVLYTTCRTFGGEYAHAMLIAPIGLKHPDHRLVFDAFDNWCLCLPEFRAFYIDTPYQTVQRNSLDLLQKITGRHLLSFYMPPVAKWKAVPIFKSQAKFFYFNSPTSLRRIPEIIVGDEQRFSLGDEVRIWHTAQ